MKNQGRILSWIIWAGIVIIALVSYHSVWEIHYLKSFYPHSFTVAEAFYAAMVELIKVALAAGPIILIIRRLSPE